MKKPLIGISAYHKQEERSFIKLAVDYAQSVTEAGGLPLILPIQEPALAGEVLDVLDGLLLSGGQDICPRYYREEPLRMLKGMDSKRDAWELALAKEAIERDAPLFGICRGLQILNIVQGGSLYQRLEVQLEGVDRHMYGEDKRRHPTHEVVVEPGTKLFACLNTRRIKVNSFHNQAVKSLGKDLEITARSISDDIIEGIELPQKCFVLGVQWHPEALTFSEHSSRLFAGLVEASGKRKAGMMAKIR